MPVSRSRKNKPVKALPKKSAKDLLREAEDKAVLAYRKQMTEVKRRIRAISGLLNRTSTTGFLATDYESIALNFRKIAELIIFASLAGHEKQYATLYPKYQREWRIKDIITKLKAINPHYYPQAVRRTPAPDERGIYTFVNVSPAHAMNEDELVKMYDTCSGFIHAKQADAESVIFIDAPNMFAEWQNKVLGLLLEHTVFLPIGEGAITCQLRMKTNESPYVVFLVDSTAEVNDQMKRGVFPVKYSS